MDYQDSFEAAAEFRRIAFTLMDRGGIPATPANYAVFYAFAARNPNEIYRALEILLSNKQEITPQICAELYDAHIGQDRMHESLRTATGKIEAALTRVMEVLGKAQAEAGDYGRTLVNFSGKLGTADGVENLRELVEVVLRETRQMADINHALEARLSATSEEIKTLRTGMDDLKRAADTDSLTGLYNRKYFDHSLRELAKNCMEQGDTLALGLIDIDHFKNFNDTYGHLVGDQVIKLVARTIMDGIKGQDVAARYGGEEFVVIFPRTALRNAMQVIDQVRQSAAGKKVTNRRTGESLGQVTLSGGLAEYVWGEPLANLIQRADAALYRAKRGGRNQVCSENDLASEKLELK